MIYSVEKLVTAEECDSMSQIAQQAKDELNYSKIKNVVAGGYACKARIESDVGRWTRTVHFSVVC